MAASQRLVVAFLLFFLIVISLRACGSSPTAAEITAAQGVALCPSSPICSRAGAPALLRRRYCGNVFSRLRSFVFGGRKGRPQELPYDSAADVKRHVLHEAEQLLAGNLVGQDHVLHPLLEALRKKLQFPSEPLVLHLAGDNGVGKTLTARLLSLAFSLRCAPNRDVCDTGDNLLSISGTSFDGLSVADARQVIVSRVLHHMRNFPHGIVLIDDFTAMDPALVPVLAPLFGRSSHYPEQFLDRTAATAAAADETGRPGEERGDASQPQAATPAASLSLAVSTTAPPSLGQLLVILTTDLGRQGRTMGKSTRQIEQLVRDTFAELYGTLLPAHTRTFAYLPFSTSVAAAVIRSAVANLPCTIGATFVRLSSIEEVAVQFLVERHRATWEGRENGHALRRVIEDELITQVLARRAVVGLDNGLVARFVLDVEKMAVVLDGAAAGQRQEDGRFTSDEDADSLGRDL